MAAGAAAVVEVPVVASAATVAVATVETTAAETAAMVETTAAETTAMVEAAAMVAVEPLRMHLRPEMDLHLSFGSVLLLDALAA